MNTYKLKLGADISSCDIAEISNNNWNYEYAPKAQSQLTFDKSKGLIVRMTCFESDPVTVFSNNYDPVFTDSCMEFFVNLCPEKSDDYINLETNSNGAFIFSYGPGRGDVRTHILPKLGISPKVTITKKSDRWIADIIIGNDALKAVYGDFEINAGYEFIGNFYKCGHTETPHYLSWSPIATEKPDFHCPPYFGRFIVE